MRKDGRQANQLRPVFLRTGELEYAEGSVLIEYGKTRLICSASLDETIPRWLQGTGKGWISAEYGMLPRSTHTRIRRDKSLTGGRTQEISRLIGRSLRAAVDLTALSERQIMIDCDVIQADGGTRTAAVTGGFVALALAVKKLMGQGVLKSNPLRHYVAAISVGLTENRALLDLCYEEDSAVETDMNVVMVDNGSLVEVQGTAEQKPFSRNHLLEMMELADHGCRELFAHQAKYVGDFFPLNKR